MRQNRENAEIVFGSNSRADTEQNVRQRSLDIVRECAFYDF